MDVIIGIGVRELWEGIVKEGIEMGLSGIKMIMFDVLRGEGSNGMDLR